VRSRQFVFILFLSLLTVPMLAQMQQQQQPQPRTTMPAHDPNMPMGDSDDTHDRLASEMAKKAAKERVAALKGDTDKLLKLSVELKNYVDKSDENVLSLDVIRKCDEIEKLAKSVRDKMKGPN
jgi:hypothetical protein